MILSRKAANLSALRTRWSVDSVENNSRPFVFIRG
jgi:hypothetical protein